MANDKSLVIAVIGIVVLAGVATMVLRGSNQEIVGNAKMFNYGNSGLTECATFSYIAYTTYTGAQLDRFCGAYCLGWNGDNSHMTRGGSGNLECCCTGEPVG